MKQLPTIFTKGKRVFTQIRQSEQGFIYKVQDEGFEYFEVFEKKINTLYDCVSYPGDKSFGVSAWCFTSLTTPRAIAKITSIFEQG